ncbi:MAG: hypothetical protein ACTSSG_08710, partial [Candidatus Heimdallarchaeaceae archaeon]
SQKLEVALDYLETKEEKREPVIICTSDCPGISVESLDTFLQFVEKNKDLDFILSLVREEVISKEFPDSMRAVARLKDINAIQGELMSFSSKVIKHYKEVIDSFTKIRRQRSFMSMVKYVARRPSSWSKVIKILVGRATLEDAILGFNRAFRLKARTVIIDDPGLGMDLDLPEDYDKLVNYVKKIKALDN